MGSLRRAASDQFRFPENHATPQIAYLLGSRAEKFTHEDLTSIKDICFEHLAPHYNFSTEGDDGGDGGGDGTEAGEGEDAGWDGGEAGDGADDDDVADMDGVVAEDGADLVTEGKYGAPKGDVV